MTLGQPELPGNGGEHDRLESWKEIATHFGKGVTTVQRWERDEGLPVHRHAHAKGGSIYAFREELEDWRRGRSEIAGTATGRAEGIEGNVAVLADVAASDAATGLSATEKPGPKHRSQLAMVAVFAMIAALLALVATAYDTVQSRSATVNDEGRLSALSGSILARVPLQSATATFSQSIFGGPFSPSQAIDRYLNPSNGWTIARDAAGVFSSVRAEVAVFETTADVTASNVVFRLHFFHFNPKHLLGRFRFSVTSDHRDAFADELHTGGDVDANWVVLQSPTVSGPAGMTFTTLDDHSVLVGGQPADEGIYTVSYGTVDSKITGIRLEALEHPSLPGGGGPGLHSLSGNFFLTELEMMVAVDRIRN